MEQAPQQIIDWIKYYSQGLPNQFLIGNIINPIFLPSYVDDVIEFSNIGTNGLSPQPVPGEFGKIYVNVDDNSQWRALSSGSSPYYIQINQKPIKLTSQVIDTTGWNLVSGFYEKTINNTSIMTTSIVDITPDNTSLTIVQNAEVSPIITCYNGSFKIYAKNIPNGNINCEIIINQSV